MKTSQIKLKQQKHDVKISLGHTTITQQTAPPWIRSSEAFPQIQAALSLEVCSHARRRSKAKPPKRGVGAVTLELQVPELPQHSWCGPIGPSFMTVLRVMGVGWISYGKFVMFRCFFVGIRGWEGSGHQHSDQRLESWKPLESSRWCSPWDKCWGFPEIVIWKLVHYAIHAAWGIIKWRKYIYNIWQHQQSIKTALYRLHVTLLDALWDSEPVITMPALSALPLQLIRFSHMNSTCWQRWPFRHRISQPAPTAMAGEKWSGFGKGGHIGRSEL